MGGPGDHTRFYSKANTEEGGAFKESIFESAGAERGMLRSTSLYTSGATRGCATGGGPGGAWLQSLGPGAGTAKRKKKKKRKTTDLSILF